MTLEGALDMAFHLIASHLQRERDEEIAHARLVRLARTGRHAPSRLDRTRAAIGLRIVALGLALGGDGARRRTREAAGPRGLAA
jgi:hypothetical protein